MRTDGEGGATVRKSHAKEARLSGPEIKGRETKVRNKLQPSKEEYGKQADRHGHYFGRRLDGTQERKRKGRNRREE